MSYTINKEQFFNSPPSDVYAAAQKAVNGLEGKFSSETPPTALTAKFHKTILGKVLGDRTELNVEIVETDGGATLKAEIFPLDAVGRKLMFGARKGVSQTVMTWFMAHLEHHLKAVA